MLAALGVAGDEDVFAIKGRNLALFTVRVGLDRRSKARYFLPRQAEIDEFLRRLVELPPCQRLR